MPMKIILLYVFLFLMPILSLNVARALINSGVDILPSTS